MPWPIGMGAIFARPAEKNRKKSKKLETATRSATLVAAPLRRIDLAQPRFYPASIGLPPGGDGCRTGAAEACATMNRELRTISASGRALPLYGFESGGTFTN